MSAFKPWCRREGNRRAAQRLRQRRMETVSNLQTEIDRLEQARHPCPSQRCLGCEDDAGSRSYNWHSWHLSSYMEPNTRVLIPGTYNST